MATYRSIGACCAAFALVGALVVALAVPARAGVDGRQPASGSATHGGIEVTGAFLPLPASSAVASAYFVLHNRGNRPDTLLSATTSVASQAMAMGENATSMSMLGPVTIPAHGRVTFRPGHDHLMLQGMRHSLKVGQRVELRLRFRHAGVVDLAVPVVPLNRILGPSTGGTKASKVPGASKTSGHAGNMRHMAGM